LSEISEAMAKVATKNGVKIHCNSPVKQVITHDKTAQGVTLENGEMIAYDSVIVNADFGTAITQLFAEKDVEKYKKSKLDKKGFSCSTYMIYIALGKKYELPFHSIFFAKNYRDNLQRIHKYEPIDKEDFSFYVRNASILDKTLAPPGHS
jgi:phytoene desaturase